MAPARCLNTIRPPHWWHFPPASFWPHPIGKVPPALQLDSNLRIALYAVLAALSVTGIGWLVADELKEGASGEIWQAIAAYLLMLHGGGSMIILVMCGALVPLHIRRGWLARRN